MIIKKKYTNINKSEPENKQETQVIDDLAQVNAAKITQEKQATEQKMKSDFSEEMSQDKENKVENEEIVVDETPPKPKNFDLDVTLENLTFEQRAERRDGSRRRGYRRTQDRNIISRAQDEAISIKEAAKQEGYKEGIEKAEEDLKQVREKFVEFFNTKEVVFDKFSSCIYDIAVEMAKRIIKKELETDKEATLTIIKAALEEVNKTENKITLKVKPQDVEIVRDKIPEYFKENYIEAKVSVIPDSSIKEGGVIVETTNGIIDATIETQVSIMEKALSNKDNK